MSNKINLKYNMVLVLTHNLQLDGLAIKLNGADLEVHSDGAYVAFCVGVVLHRGRREQGEANRRRGEQNRARNVWGPDSNGTAC